MFHILASKKIQIEFIWTSSPVQEMSAVLRNLVPVFETESNFYEQGLGTRYLMGENLKGSQA